MTTEQITLPFDSCQEEWRTIPDFPDYEVSSLGRIRRGNKVLKFRDDGNGYFVSKFWLRLSGGHIHVKAHIFVASAFLGPRPPGMDINHKDGNKKNNRPENLEYVSRSENAKHACQLGLHKMIGNSNPQAKLTEPEVYAILKMLAEGERVGALARQFGVNPATISDIKTKRTWKHIT